MRVNPKNGIPCCGVQWAQWEMERMVSVCRLCNGLGGECLGCYFGLREIGVTITPDHFAGFQLASREGAVSARWISTL